MKNILILPHVQRGSGGAGLYNEYLIQCLAKNYKLVVGNEYDYLITGVRNESIVEPGILLMPNYRGVKILSKIFYIAIFIPLVVIYFIKITKIIKKLKNYDAVIGTSSIQIALLWLLRILGYRGYIYIYIQENLILDGFIGSLMAAMLRCFTRAYAINEYWRIYAKNRNIESILIENKFENINALISTEPVCDIIYVGGDQKIKGFDFLLDKIKKLKKYKIIFLGEYSQKNIKKINDLCLAGLDVKVIGKVSNVDDYLKDAKLLVIPIVAAHYCRPAVEAGLMRRTFIIPKIEGLNDFAIDEYNCLMYDAKSPKDFIDKIEKILDDENLRELLSCNNYKLATKIKIESDSKWINFKLS